jgi:hypothetical protein
MYLILNYTIINEVMEAYGVSDMIKDKNWTAFANIIQKHSLYLLRLKYCSDEVDIYQWQSYDRISTLSLYYEDDYTFLIYNSINNHVESIYLQDFDILQEKINLQAYNKEFRDSVRTLKLDSTEIIDNQLFFEKLEYAARVFPNISHVRIVNDFETDLTLSQLVE